MKGLAQQFSEALQAVGGAVHFARDASEAQALLEELLLEAKASTLVHHAAESIAPLQPDCLALECIMDVGLAPATHRDACARADAGLTGALCGIAATGTLVLACGPRTPRATSLLPPLHVALLHAETIVPDMATAMRRWQTTPLPSQLIHITGPSRTGDIEHDLTTGVHGPARLAVILLDTSSAS